MRLIHTADWHLGQTFYSHERSLEHQRFLDWLLDTLVAEQADVLLVAGDVFDSANPSSEAQRQLYGFLSKARRLEPAPQIVLTAGNHDSPGRLEAPSPLLAAMDVTVVGHVRRRDGGAIDLDRLIVPLHDRSGAVGAWCLAIPFLRPGDVPKIETDGDAFAEGIAALYAQTLALALERRAPGQAIVALGHCHAQGGSVSEESERRIVIGGAELLSVATFDPRIAYTALGHLHRPQTVRSEPPVVYSGSPLPMGFSEIGYAHRVVRIDLEGEHVAAMTDLRVPRSVELLRVPAAPAPTAEVVEALRRLELPERPVAEQPYLLVRVLLETPEPGLRAEVERALEGKAVRLARIEITTPRRAAETREGFVSPDDLQKLRPEDVFRRRLTTAYPDEPPKELLDAFRELLVETPA